MKTTSSATAKFNASLSLRRHACHVLILLAVATCLAGVSYGQGVAYIQELKPPSVTAGSGDTTLTVDGVNFQSNAVVKFDGTTLSFASPATACTNFNQCKMTVPANLIATAHTAIVTVTNPSQTPSNTFVFPVGSNTPATFTNTPAIVGMTPQAIAVADLNGDGKPDLIIVNAADNNISVLLGNGVDIHGFALFMKPDGTPCGGSTSALCPTYPTGHNPRAVVVGDFKNTGHLDVVVANHDDNTLSFFEGDGSGNLAAASTIDLAGVAPVGLVAEDLDFDGNLDLFVLNQNDSNCQSGNPTGTGSLEVLFGDGTGKFSNFAPKGVLPVSDICLDIAPVAMAVGNIDNNLDGGLGPFADVVITSGAVPAGPVCAPGDGTVTVVDGASIFNTAYFIVPPPPGSPNQLTYSCAGPNPSGVTVGDFNNDDVLDVAVTNTNGRFAVLLNVGGGVFGVPNSQSDYVSYPAGTNTPSSIIAGDFNGDGKVDLAMADGGSAVVTIASGKGDGTFPDPFSGPLSSTGAADPFTGTSISGNGPAVLVAADFNADGRLDIATANKNDNPGSATILVQNSQPQLTVLCTSGENPPASTSASGCVGPPQPGATGTPSLSFGDVVLGTNVQLSLEVQNDLAITASYNAITNGNITPGGNFTQTNTCGTSLAASANCTITVTFTPQGSGEFSAQLQVPGLNGSSQSISLSGTGIQAAGSFTPQGLSFNQTYLANVPTGANIPAAPQLTATLTNTGNSELDFSSAPVSSTSDFTLVGTSCSSPLKAADASASPPVQAGSCTVTVSLTPKNIGLVLGSITFSTNIGVLSLTLQGQGSAPTVTLSNPPLLFSNQQVGTPSAPQTIVLTNIGNGQLYFTSSNPFALTTGYPGDFALTNNTCPSWPNPLNAGNSCVITIAFTPAQLGPEVAARSTRLVITDNDGAVINGAGQPADMDDAAGLNGVATWPVVSYNVPLSPTVALSYGGVPFMTTSAPQSFVISNLGTAPLLIKSIASTDDPEFRITGNTCPASLAINTNCIVTVKFTPQADGARAGTIIVTDNDQGTPSFSTTQTLALNGTGTDFSLSVTPPSVTIPAGKTATYKIALTPIDGFNNSVTYTCAGGPPHSNCFISGTSNGSATIILSTSKGANHGTFGLTFTATYTAASPAGGSPGNATLAHMANASITIK
jgi:hypothetical protein